MLARVNLPRRKRDSKPAFGTYSLTFADGSAQTVRTDEPLRLSAYTDVAAAYALNGGTIVADNNSVTLGGTGGDFGLSLVGGKWGTQVFAIGGGDVTISNFDGDTIDLGDNIFYAPRDSAVTVGTFQFADFYANPKGSFVIENITNTTPVKINENGKQVIVYKSTNNPYGLFSGTDMTRVVFADMTNQFGDYGVCGTSPTSTSIRGTEYFNGIISITSHFANSTIVGNANFNEITVAGGKENFIVGGLGNDSIKFESGGGVIVDYGVGADYDGKKIYFAQSTSQTPTSATFGYNRFDVGTYYANTPYLQVKGTVTDIYYNGTTDANTKKIPTCDYVIAYTDNSGETQLVLLKNLVKKTTTPNATESRQIFQTNRTAAEALKIYHGKNGETPINKDNVSSYFRELDTLPESLQPVLDRLNEIYASSGYRNSLVR